MVKKKSKRKRKRKRLRLSDMITMQLGGWTVIKKTLKRETMGFVGETVNVLNVPVPNWIRTKQAATNIPRGCNAALFVKLIDRFFP